MVWVDKVRQAGMDSSFIKREKDPKQLLKEIKFMLEYIDKEIHTDWS